MKQCLYHGSTTIVEHTLAKLVYHGPNLQMCILNQSVADACLHYLSNEKL